MPRRKLLASDCYQYAPRRTLQVGDRFRVSGGPIYITDDGTKIPVYERGVFVFRRYCERGTAKWLEAHRADGSGFVVLWVGKSCRSGAIPNLRRRPYRITQKCADKPGGRRTKHQRLKESHA